MACETLGFICKVYFNIYGFFNWLNKDFKGHFVWDFEGLEETEI